MVTIAISDNVMCISSLWKVFVLVYTCYMVNMVNGETVSETFSNPSIEATSQPKHMLLVLNFELQKQTII